MATRFSLLFRPLWDQFHKETGLSLNYVADRAKWLPGGKGLDVSVLSRVLQGNTVQRFDDDKLKALCTFMKISNWDREVLRVALFYDRAELKDIAIPESVSSTPFDRDLVDAALTNGVDSYLRGDFVGARVASGRIADEIEARLRQPFASDSVRQMALHRLARVQFHIGRCTYQGSLSEIQLVLPPIATALAINAEQLEDPGAKEEVLRLEDITRGFLAYFLGNYAGTASYLSRALKSEYDPDTKLWLMRTYSVSLARLAEDSAFRMVESQAKGLIREESWTRLGVICSLREGLGRGYTILSSKQAAARSFAQFEEGVAKYLTIPAEGKEHFRHMQLGRSILEAQNHFGTVDHSYDPFIEDAIYIGRTFSNMPRHLASVEFEMARRRN